MPTKKTVTLLAETPSSVTQIKTTVRRSWKTRIVIIANTAVAFILALLAYLQTINLANLGITAEKALFWTTIIGIVQVALAQYKPISVQTEVQPGHTEEQG